MINYYSSLTSDGIINLRKKRSYLYKRYTRRVFKEIMVWKKEYLIRKMRRTFAHIRHLRRAFWKRSKKKNIRKKMQIAADLANIRRLPQVIFFSYHKRSRRYWRARRKNRLLRRKRCRRKFRRSLKKFSKFLYGIPLMSNVMYCNDSLSISNTIVNDSFVEYEDDRDKIRFKDYVEEMSEVQHLPILTKGYENFFKLSEMSLIRGVKKLDYSFHKFYFRYGIAEAKQHNSLYLKGAILNNIGRLNLFGEAYRLGRSRVKNNAYIYNNMVARLRRRKLLHLTNTIFLKLSWIIARRWLYIYVILGKPLYSYFVSWGSVNDLSNIIRFVKTLKAFNYWIWFMIRRLRRAYRNYYAYRKKRYWRSKAARLMIRTYMRFIFYKYYMKILLKYHVFTLYSLNSVSKSMKDITFNLYLVGITEDYPMYTRILKNYIYDFMHLNLKLHDFSVLIEDIGVNRVVRVLHASQPNVPFARIRQFSRLLKIPLEFKKLEGLIDPNIKSKTLEEDDLED